jgi:hypothetical protein
MIARAARFLAGALLLPACVAASRSLLVLVREAQPGCAAAVPPAALALGGGLALWLAAFFTLPRPVRSYVLAHELTHALWGALMGARVLRLVVGRQRGSVTLSKSNFLVTLAPYFFPLYTVLVIAAYYALSLFVNMARYDLLWLGAVGLTWGFHLTFTVATLMQRQTDIQECGRLFSYALIYLLNVLGICLWVVVVSPATLEQMVSSFSGAVRDIAAALSAAARGLAAWTAAAAGRGAQ